MLMETSPESTRKQYEGDKMHLGQNSKNSDNFLQWM